MTNPVNPHSVAVTVVNDCGTYKIADIPDLTFDKNKAHMHKKDFHTIFFDVVNSDGISNYRFDTSAEPFSVKNKVPPIEPGAPSAEDVCAAKPVAGQGDRLIVINKNPDHRVLKYTLHLVGGPAKQPTLTYDPIMSNQDGGARLEQRNLTILGGILAAAAIVAGVALVASLVRNAEDD